MNSRERARWWAGDCAAGAAIGFITALALVLTHCSWWGVRARRCPSETVRTPSRSESAAVLTTFMTTIQASFEGAETPAIQSRSMERERWP
jgi:hypothetical protein